MTPPLHFPNKKGEAAGLAAKIWLSVLTGWRKGLRQNIDPAAAFVESNFAIHQGEQSPIAAGADVFSRNEFRAALTHQDTAGADQFAAIAFYTESFADAVATIA